VSWVAGTNKFFDGMTFDDARHLLGTASSDTTEEVEAFPELPFSRRRRSKDAGDIPSSFDARTKWPGLIHPIRNQERCGSCWAFSASEVMSDRVAIAANESSPVLSPEDMVSCDNKDSGCGGGVLSRAWNYIKDTGLLTEACFPYAAGDGKEPGCATACADGSPMVRTKAASNRAIYGVEAMQLEIQTHGLQELHVLQVWCLPEALVGALP